jgi:hypothetical protein
LAHIEETFHSIFQETGKITMQPVHLELTDPNAKPYHGKQYQVPHSLLPLLKKEVERLCEIGVLHKTNNSEWAAQGFAIKKEQADPIRHRFLHAEPIATLIPISAIFHSRNYAYS